MKRRGRILRRVLIGLAVLVVLAGAGFTWMIGGPRNVIGMLRYDQRREGDLKVGDTAPDVTLVALDGATRVPLREKIGDKPLILVFGSYT